LLKLDLCAERKERPCRHTGGVEEKLQLFLTSVLDGVGGECHPTPCPGRSNLGGPQDRSGLVERRKSLLPPPGFDPRTVQPVAAVGVARYSKNCLLGCTRGSKRLRTAPTANRSLLSANLDYRCNLSIWQDAMNCGGLAVAFRL